MAVNPRQMALLQLRKKLHGVIAQGHQPHGGAAGAPGAPPSQPPPGGGMGAGAPPDAEDLADGGADEAAEGEAPVGGLGPMDGKGAGNPLHETFAAYMNPKPKARRPGTGVAIGIMHGAAPAAPVRGKPFPRKGVV